MIHNIPDLRISDVIDVIEEHVRTKTVEQMDNSSSNNGRRPTTSPCIKIVEQPASKALRFRYECEGRSAGSIPGVNSTTDNKTYPTIQIVGYKGRAVVVVSCVTEDDPYRPHPHNLVGNNCKKGYCSIEFMNESMEASFQNLGIQCVKRNDFYKALKVREHLKIDPFGTGFFKKEELSSIALNKVRLCFQAYLKGENGEILNTLKPIVSDPIYDKKAMSDLSICRLSDAAASVVGDKEIILLCEKVTKDDIQVRFFEEKDGKCIWEDYGVFKASDVHKQVAIWFKTPKYKTTEIDSPVTVWIQLKRPSDSICSDALPFTFTPDYSDPVMKKRKRQILSSESKLLIQLPSNPIRHKDQSCNFIDGMVEQLPISVPTIQEPEPSPNLLSGIHSLPNSSVLQHLPSNNSRTPSQSEYWLPNVNNISSYGQTTFQNTNIQLNTTVWPTINSHNPTSYAPPTTITTTPLPCPTESNNESNLMEDTFSSLNSSDFRTLLGDSEHALSTNLSASLHLTENSVRVESNPEKVVQDNKNMSDSFDRIANNTLNEFCEFYT